MRKTLAIALLLLASALHADELTDKVKKIAASVDATIGVSAFDLSTGRKFEFNGDERFPMASVYKFPIAELLLRKVSNGEISLDQNVTIYPGQFAPGHSPLAEAAKNQEITLPLGNVAVLALRDSDNTASDAMLRAVGGPEAVTKNLRFMGITEMNVSRSEKQIAADMKKGGGKSGSDERDTATPNAMVMLLRLSETRGDGIGSASRIFITEALRNSTTGARRIRAGVPSGCDVYTKTGTAFGVVNDAGIVKSPEGRHRIALAIFTKGAKKSSEKAREDSIAAIARAIYEEFTRWQ